MDPELIAIGMAIGIAVTAPLGPVNLTVIRSALRAGMAGGMAAASGSIAGDALFATLAAYGVRWVEDWVHAHSTAILSTKPARCMVLRKMPRWPWLFA